MHDHRTQLASLIASRICHDLISPVGAISNGLELVSLGGGMNQGPELDLITESVENANARIRFFRIAFGAAQSDANVSSAEVCAILDGITRGGRLKVHWEAGGDVSRVDVQLAFLALQCVETAMLRGGDVFIEPMPGRVSLRCDAQRIAPDPALWRHLDGALRGGAVMGEPIDIAPAHVQFALLPLLASDRGRKPHVEHTETSLSLIV